MHGNISKYLHPSKSLDLPLAVMVKFDKYCGPTFHDGTVPITPIRHTWLSSSVQCSHLQLPLKLAWVAIHKSQELTLDKAVIDIGKREISIFVACSRVCQLQDLLFVPAVLFQRLGSFVNSKQLAQRKAEDQRLMYIKSCMQLDYTDHLFILTVNFYLAI